MQITQAYPAPHAVPHYTTRHRHHLPSGGYTDWSEGIANGRHSHGVADADHDGYVAQSVGSPVHKHAWNTHCTKGIKQGYTSGPLVEGALVPAARWISRFLGR
jgi:hypothetical protein